MSSARVKICGVTRLEDALDAVELGADALGFNFCPISKRYCHPEKAAEIIHKLPPFVSTVAVFVNFSVEDITRSMEQAGCQAVQLHGDEPPTYVEKLRWPVIRTVRVDANLELENVVDFPANAFLFDTATSGFGGSGQTFDWTKLQRLHVKVPIILAGGLTPDNVSQAVAQVRPYAVDVASGVESSPGIKDKNKVAQFIRAAKGAHP